MVKDSPLRDIVKKIISDFKKTEEKEENILKAWEKAAGKKAAKHSKPAFLKGRRMVVNVSDSSWLYKLTLEKENVRDSFNAHLKGKKKIKELQFRIGQAN